MFQRALFGAMILLTVTGCTACKTDQTGNEPPTITTSGIPADAFIVGDTLRIGIEAVDPEGSDVTFDWDYKPKELDWTVEDRADFLTFEGRGTASFIWDPLASDAIHDEPIQLIFIAKDDSGAESEKVETIDIVPGNGLPVFESNASELYDPRTGKPLTFEVEVRDNDSNEVTLQMVPDTAPVGASFTQNGPFEGTFNWQPGSDQLDRRIHSVRFTADDGENEPVEFKVTVVIRTASSIDLEKDQATQDCPGEAIVAHTPLGPQYSAAEPYPIEATITGDRFDEVFLYWTTADAYNGDFDPSDEDKRLVSVSMDKSGSTYTAEIPTQIELVQPDNPITVKYNICAIDNDATDDSAFVCAPSSGNLELFYTFTAYEPDAGCVDDSLDQTIGNDDFGSATTMTDTWDYYRVCDGNSDFHTVQVRGGQTVLVGVTYPMGQDISLTGYDDSQSEVSLDQSACTGMATGEFSVPEGDGTRNFYIEASGDNVTYQVRLFELMGTGDDCADADNEPNEDAATATPVTDGESLTAEMCHGGDYDVYAIDLTSGDHLAVTHEFTNADGNLDMELYAPSQESEVGDIGAGVTYTFATDDVEVLEHDAMETGTYWLLVFNNNETSLPYDLTFEVDSAPPCADDDQFTSQDANHSQSNAALVDSESGLKEWSGLAVCPGKPDWYRRTEFNGATVLGELTVTGGDGTIDDVTVEVFDLQQNLVTSGTVTNNRIDWDFTPASTDAYFYEISTTARVTYDFSLLR